MRRGHRQKLSEEAVRGWERVRLAALARDGYQGTAAEDLADAEACLAALHELPDGRSSRVGVTRHIARM